VKLYFARHGESEANVQRIHWNKPYGYGLTQKGRAQAEALADDLADMPFAALYCSPILRAAQTAQIVGQRLGLTPQVAPALREVDCGILEGRPNNPASPNAGWRVVLQWMQHDKHDARFEAEDNGHPGESYHDIAARFMPFIDSVAELYGHTEANVLLISHGTTLTTMLPLLLSNVDKPFVMSRPHFDGSFYVVAELRDGEWVCLRWGEEILME
jgi:broad specificity phosphatase PhoE